MCSIFYQIIKALFFFVRGTGDYRNAPTEEAALLIRRVLSLRFRGLENSALSVNWEC
jgi:hypothetical protein